MRRPADRRVVLADVARLAGTSEATASRALKDDPRIGETTRAAVHAAATRLGYVPNAAARSLRARRTHILGLILDDLAYVSKDQAETSVLFELIGTRYERRSMLITANQPFGEWGKVFPDQAMTLAAIDRLVHHSTILEMNVESYRRRAALERKRGRGRPPTRAKIKEKL